MKIDLAVVTFEGDSRTLCFQAISINKFVDIDFINKIFVIYNGNNYIQYKDYFFDNIINFYGKFKPIVVLVDGKQFVDNSFSHGWISQQLLKLNLFRICESDLILSIDSKLFFKQKTAEDYFFYNNKIKAFFHRDEVWSLPKYINSLSVFDLQDDGQMFLPSSPPFFFTKSHQEGLVQYIENKFNLSFPDWFSKNDVTEYLLYFAYLKSQNLIEELFHSNHLMMIGGGGFAPKQDYIGFCNWIATDTSAAMISIHRDFKFDAKMLVQIRKSLQNYFTEDELNIRFMFSISIILVTRNRADQIVNCLNYITELNLPKDLVFEVIVVDNNSNDTTSEVVKKFQSKVSFKTQLLFEERLGSSHAKNCGIRGCDSDVIIFTDDDCYLEKNYIINFLEIFDPKKYQYGMGEILLFDTTDDPRVANLEIKSTVILPPNNVVPAGMLQGANMFFLNRIFKHVGLFNGDMGAGTEFHCEDLDMGCRASFAGYTGALLPGFTVYHNHGRKIDSPEAIKSMKYYDYGRGAYYANLLLLGNSEGWNFWKETFVNNDLNTDMRRLEVLSRELFGASKYLDFIVDKLHKN